ncbi:MAG: ABC transporter permease [Syntrophomonas sp.]|uniref:ABC transporter permease n=1 Tax=Syntrophomonas sp. TaxID=2053627 RepID=UPI002637B889|nr:ABC transporter permease [Syntrophomonas sp.]MDD4626536.1 ABC transporter permease [Syntrophomonas sp.]
MRTMLNIANYEVRHILKDRVAFAIVFLAPLFYAFLMGSVYFSAAINDVPFALVDLDHSLASREVVNVFSSGQHFKINPEIDSYEKMETAMREGIIRGGIVIPEDFSQKLSQKQGTEVLAVYDASNLLWGYNVRKFAYEGMDEFNRRYAAAYLQSMGMHPTQSDEVLNMVRCSIMTWYNPTYSYINFLYAGVIFIILHQLGLLGITLTIPREKEGNTWIHYLASPLERWQIIFGKSLPYIIAGFFNYALLLWFAHQFILLKIEGSILLILLLGFLYTCAIMFLGFFISLYAENSLQISRYLILLSIPIFMISGYTWPRYRIPGVIIAISELTPFTWMAEAFRKVTIKNLGFPDIAFNVLGLIIMIIIGIGLSFTFRKDREPVAGDKIRVNGGLEYPRRV